MNVAARGWNPLLVVLLLLGHVAARAADGEGRVPWMTGRVSGSPEAPPAFELKRVYPKLRFTEPVDMEFVADGDRVVVLEQKGKIFSFPRGTPDLEAAELMVDVSKGIDFKAIPGCRGFDGLYGIAFHPRFAENRFVYVCYALAFHKSPAEPIGTRVSRFTVGRDSFAIDRASERILFEWHAGGHNGGCLKFGPDGFLYVSTGDQASPNPPDPFKTGQDVSDLRASILRVDVNREEEGRRYAIPRDNPFANRAGARGEVWGYGLRNPWRMGFDRATGNLWVADVGWEVWETVHCVKAGTNCGWSVAEGPQPVNFDWPRGPTPVTPAALAVSHAESASITGGFVYRGKRYPQLVGHYVFGDWETRRVWAAKLSGPDKLEPHRTIARTDARVVGFGEDAEGELYVIDHEGGGLHELVPNPAADRPTTFPRTLAATGLFEDVKGQRPAAGVIPFAVKAPQWMDGAAAERFAAIPGDGKITWRTDDVYARLQRNFPTDSVLARTFSVGPKNARRRVETQLLHFDGKGWQGYSYRWRDDQSDADLVAENGDERRLVVEDATVPGGKREQTWRFMSRAQCMTCHTSWSGYTLGFTDEQIDGPGSAAAAAAAAAAVGGAAAENQLQTLRRVGLLPGPYKKAGRSGPGEPPAYKLVDPDDARADVADRARSYLHANCAHCHRMGGGGSALIDLRREMTVEQMRVVDQRPMLGTFGIDDARLVAPGDPARSVLLYRMAKHGSGRMPRIGSEVVDGRAVGLVGRWIEGMKPKAAPVVDAADAAAVEKAMASPAGALGIVYRIDAGEVAEPVRGPVIERGLKSGRADVRELFERWGSGRPRLGAGFDRAKVLAMTGDAGRGREVFEKIAQCAACHAGPGVKGSDFGPDLSRVGAKYDRAGLLEHVVEPSKVILEGYAGSVVETTDGEVHAGIVTKRDATEVVLRDAALQTVRVPAAEVKGVRPQAVSVMPEGLLDGLEAQQAADLLEWLAGAK
jgi:putative heme-binding domain-containing protein